MNLHHLPVLCAPLLRPDGTIPDGVFTVAEDCRRKFGVYPEAILADKICQTRANRSYCKERGIRLSGPALGRPKSGEAGRKEARQTYKDSCERNAVEGRNGNLKRRYGLNLIMSKLDETAKTEAALNILAMNAAQRLRRWLLLIFKILGLEVVFQQTLLIRSWKHLTVAETVPVTLI